MLDPLEVALSRKFGQGDNSSSGGGVTIRNQNKTITENGSYRADSGYTGLGTVTVNVPQEDPVLQDKTVTENGTVTADAGFDGLGVVTVNVTASGGGDDLARAIVGRTVTEYIDSEVTVIGQGAFMNCVNLTEVSCDNVECVRGSAFEACTALDSVSFPNATEIYGRAFYGCAALKNIYFPKVTKINAQYAFSQCNSLTEITLPEFSTGADTIFVSCKGLVAVNFPKLVSVSVRMFDGCSNLVDVKVPNLSGRLNGVKGMAFNNCTSLRKLDAAFSTEICAAAFNNCGLFKVLALRYESACSLVNVSAFTNTPFASGGTGGYCLVPSAMIASYQAATNWATLYTAGTCTFLAIEDYTVDGSTTGALDEDKIATLLAA